MSSEAHYISFVTGESTRPRRTMLVPLVLTTAIVGAVTVFFFNAKTAAVPALNSAHFYSEAEVVREFEGFMSTNGRVYASMEEKAERYSIFKKNLAYIRAHNSQGYRYTLAVNNFADMTNEEFRAQYVGYKPRAHAAEVDLTLGTSFGDDAPAEVDWVAKGCVTPVKNQGQCGSCWAFSATGALEGAACAAGLPLPNLSEQHLVDCATKEGNMGCSGGEMQLAFQYVQRNGGLCSEEDYPYKAVNGQCKSSSCKNVFDIDGYRAVPQDDEKAIMEAIAKYGPVAIAIEADQMSFQFYSSGVFDGDCGDNLDHGVLVVGYGTDAASGLDYFTVKNSWGSRWGDNGFIKLVRGKGPHGQCGMLLDASYPLVSKKLSNEAAETN